MTVNTEWRSMRWPPWNFHMVLMQSSIRCTTWRSKLHIIMGSVRKASEQFSKTKKALILPPGHPIAWCDYSLIDSLNVFVHCVHVCVCVFTLPLCVCIHLSTCSLYACLCSGPLATMQNAAQPWGSVCMCVCVCVCSLPLCVCIHLSTCSLYACLRSGPLATMQNAAQPWGSVSSTTWP